MSELLQIVSQIKAGKTSALEQVNLALAKADQFKDYHAVLSVSAERALQRARQIDQKIAQGLRVGKLAGVPFIAKDNFLTLEMPTTAASHLLKNFHSPIQATAIEKLEEAGAICIGKANLDAFGHGGSTENSAFGPTKNAYDTSKVAGGSSGGSAVGVALDIVPFALATDTGGSIRQPASFNNVVGVKPTYGMISRYGVIAMASSTDVVGTMTKTVEDAEIVLDILSGQDNRDAMTLPDYFEIDQSKPAKKKIGIIQELMDENIDPQVMAIVQAYIAKAHSQGHVLEKVSLPILHYTLAMYYIIVPAEISSNLARFDGVRYGQRAAAKKLITMYRKSREQGFTAENQRRIMTGNYVLSSSYYDAYYDKAQKARSLLIAAYKKMFEHYDFLLGPVAPTPAFAFGERARDPIKMYMADVLTVGPSLASLPAISVPAGMTTQGLPVGVQLIGPTEADASLLSFAKSIEGQTNE